MFDIIASLEEFGFTRNESLVYTCLLETGPTHAGPVIQKTGIHRQIVYQALGSLEKKGFVIPSIKHGKKHFQAASPNGILRAVEEKAEHVKTILPQLIALQSRSADSVEVRTLYGHDGFVSNLKELIDSSARTDKEMRIIGGAPDRYFYAMIGDWYEGYVESLQKQHIAKKLIAPENYADEFKQKFAGETGNELRFMGVGLTAPTYTRMTPEMVSIEIYVQDRDVTVIQIRNRAIAQAYIEHFNLLWSQAKEYTKA